jgi:hypothetical protein
MLKAGVRTLMGSDGGGEEHSAIATEYKLAEQLINYWKAHDDQFPRGLTVDVLYKNVEDHLRDMREDKRISNNFLLRADPPTEEALRQTQPASGFKLNRTVQKKP